MDVILEIGLLAAIATLISIIARMLKQPLIIGYIICGILAGPYVFNLLQSTETIEAFSHIGITLLLFIVGLGLSPKVIKEVGKASVFTGIGQVLFTSLFGYLICLALGFSEIESMYIAIALTFSSTIIIMKLLSDKGDLETLYGKISIGFLIIQDFIAVIALMVISSSQAGSSYDFSFMPMVITGVLLLAGLFVFGALILPRITKIAASNQEVLLIFAIGWSVILAAIFQQYGFSMEIGALLAGITLSMSPYKYEISARMRVLRDFFIILFFVLLGSQMVFADVSDRIPEIILLSLFILIGNPLIVMIIMGLLGYTKRTGLFAGFTVAQISEFSIILVALGAKVGHLSNEIVSIVTIVGIITIAGSTYMILYSSSIYNLLSGYLGIFERSGKKVEEQMHKPRDTYDIVMFGYNRIGHGLSKNFREMKKSFLVVDFNPETIKILVEEKEHCVYGDAGDTEFLDSINLKDAKMILSTIPDFENNLIMVRHVRKYNKKAVILVVSHQIDQALELYSNGVNYVILPHFLGGQHVASLVERYGFNHKAFLKQGKEQIKLIIERQKLGHDHPKHL
ncbi:MAG: cation:proton antiporter [Candidatus ainarchaeum sp.]|nr:cation:proton antiporter [Candidatus ainarchaeum sp.]